MRKLGFILAAVAALLWSAAVWSGYALLVSAGAFVTQNAGTMGLPAEAVTFVAWAGVLFGRFGEGAATVLWLLGLGLIAIAFFLFKALAARISAPPQPREPLPQTAPETILPPARPSKPAATVWGRDAAQR